MFRGDAETVDLPCPNRRNKGLKPLAPHDPLTADLGFRVKRREALSPLSSSIDETRKVAVLAFQAPSKSHGLRVMEQGDRFGSPFGSIG